MGNFGKSVAAGKVSLCAQCHNKAEVKRYENDNPDPICEDCHNDNVKLEGMISEKREAAAVEGGEIGRPSRRTVSDDGFVQHNPTDSERSRYIAIITAGADAAWVKSFISEVMVKRVLQYDWKEIIKFERWFSVLDLRRFALEIDPDFENPKTTERTHDEVQAPPIPTIRKRRTQRNKGVANAQAV